MSFVEIKPGSLEEALSHGRALLDSRPEAALAQADQLLKSDAALLPALRLRARALRAMRRTADADKADIAAIRASEGHPLLGRVAAALRSGAGEAFIAPLTDHVGRQPDDAFALILLGQALTQDRRAAEAEPHLRAAIAAAPGYPEAHVALAWALREMGRDADALAALQPAVAGRPNDVRVMRFQATLLGQVGEHRRAADIYRGLLRFAPSEPALWISLGDALRTLGQAGEAERAYRLGLGRVPGNGRLWWSLAASGVRFDDADMAAMQAALGRGEEDDAVHLHFALARALEGHGAHEAAFHHYAAGNRLRYAALDYDPRDTDAEIADKQGRYTAAFLSRRPAISAGGPVPIFVIGMPRSGSTLVEQILDSHPQIEATAELTVIPALARALADGGSSYEARLAAMSAEEMAEWGQRYLDWSKVHRRTDKPFFIDKLPHNWFDIGLIRSILPQAKIVDARRSAMDCCWSNFRLLFGHGHPASYSLEAMAAYYRAYVRLMAHIDTVQPGLVHRIVYEDLIDDLEGETRRLLAYLGVPFDPACLAFHENDRPVATASAEQVRRPLNRSGIGAWRPFEPWLGPLKAALGDLAE